MGRQFLISLRTFSEYLYMQLDERLPYFSHNGGYDIHTLLYDNIQIYLYGTSLEDRSPDTQLEYLIDEMFPDCDYSRDLVFDVRIQLSVMRSELNEILRNFIPKVETWWHFNYKFDESMTLWLVIE